MKRGWRVLVVLAGLMLALAGCTSSTSPTGNVVVTPSESPSPSPTPVVASPSPSPSPSPTGAALAITALPFHNGEVGIGYLAVQLAADGGTSPYTWSIGGGEFPPGLTLSTDGNVTGKNTKAGQFSFTVKVMDYAGASATAPGGFGVFAALSVNQPCITQCTVGAGCAVCGGVWTLSGGLGTDWYKVRQGGLP